MQKYIITTLTLLCTLTINNLGAMMVPAQTQKPDLATPTAPEVGRPAALPEYYKFLATDLKTEKNPSEGVKKIKAFLNQHKNQFNQTDPKILYPILNSIRGKFNISPIKVYLLWRSPLAKTWYNNTMQSLFPDIDIAKAQKEISSTMGPWTSIHDMYLQSMISPADYERFKKILVFGIEPNIEHSFAAVTDTTPPKFLKALLQIGLDPNYQSSVDQNTFLIEATKNNRKDLVEILLKQGAKRHLKDMDGKSAIDYAADKPEIAKVLQEKMR